MDKFRKAIQSVVKKDNYVVDIGTGSGVLAILAAKVGARKVTAIDVNQESLDYAKRAALMNGVEDVIEFFEGSYLDFVPDEMADVVICEMLSSMLLVEQQVPASVYALQNILKNGGVILPQEVTVFVVPVECALIWERFNYEDLRFPRVVQTATSDAVRDLADMQVLTTLDLTSLKEINTIDKTLTFTIVNKGTLHGLVGVFESRLYDDIQLNMDDGWKQLFIPLDQPIEVSSGDVFSTRISFEPGEYDSLSIVVL